MINEYKMMLLQYLHKALLTEHNDAYTSSGGDNQINYNDIVTLADRHAVAPLIYDVIDGDKLVPEVKRYLENVTKKIVLQNYRLLFLEKYIMNILEDNGIDTVLLKGASISRYYPVPEYRKSGDVDLFLLDEGNLLKARDVLTGRGFKVSAKQHSNHHLVLLSEEGIEVEIHTMLVEPFDSGRINDIVKRLGCRLNGICTEEDVMGIKLRVMPDGYNGWYILLHMLQHFLLSGFGLRLLCDWVVFWNRDIEPGEVKRFIALVKESRIEGFLSVITSVCVYYLGMLDCKDPEYTRKDGTLYYKGIAFCKLCDRDLCEDMLNEIFDAEEFGESDSERMVMLRKKGITSYIREFHHQMKRNYPHASRIILIWPALWTTTLVRFVHNNRKIRKVSSFDILKNAHKRSDLMEKIDIFK